MRQFEDLVVGDMAVSRQTIVDRQEMLEFARQFDPQWFHTDPEEARKSVFGEVIASGIFTAAVWRRLDHEINGDVDFICGVAWEDVRWPKAMRAGDRVHATSRILDKRGSATDPTRGVAVFQYGLVNQHDEEVFSCRSVNLVQRRRDVD